MLRKALLLLALVLICSGTALAQVGGIQAQQTASTPLQLRITDGNLTSVLGTFQFKATNILLSANQTNYIYLDLTQNPPALTVNTTGFPSANYYAIAIAVTNSKQITSLTDSRPSFNSASFSGGSGGSVDIAVFTAGTNTNSQKLLRIALTRQITFPASATLSQATASANATGSTVYTLTKNGVSFATVTFSGGSATGTWTQASSTTFAAGDVLEIDGPATADATLADVGITLAGCKGTATSCS